MKKLLLLVAVLCGVVFSTEAQNNSQMITDVIYTTDGLILQGTIVEQVPGVTYTITTLDGKTYNVDALSVKRITREVVNSPMVTENHIYHHNPYRPHKYDENGNVIQPASVSTAFFYSLIIPGMGQFYNGEGLKGALLFTGTVVGLLGATVGTNMVGSAYENLVGYPSLALTAGCYLYSLIDAPVVAARWNKKYGFTGREFCLQVVPTMGVVGGATSADTAVGMSLSLTF